MCIRDSYNLAASIQTLPLGNNKQCVIIKQFEKIKEPFAEKINILISKLSFKNNDLQLLLFSQDKKIPKNIIIKNIEKYGVLVLSLIHISILVFYIIGIILQRTVFLPVHKILYTTLSLIHI